MPAVITHDLVAERSARQFPPNLFKAVRENPDDFFLGAQGPDLFFFYRPFSKREENAGKVLHRRHIYGLFSFLLCKLREGESREEHARLLAYAAGFIAHYAADTVFHPVVYAALSEGGEKGLIHQRIENDWDVYFYRKLCGKEANEFVCPFSPKKINREGTLFAFFSEYSAAIGRKRVDRRKFRRAVKLFALYLKIFHKNCYRRQRRRKKAERLFRTPPRLSCLYPQENPPTDLLTGDTIKKIAGGRDADGLFVRAVAESARLAQLFSDALVTGDLPKEEFNRSYLTAEEVPAASNDLL